MTLTGRDATRHRHEYSLVPIIDGRHHWGKRINTGDWQGTQDGNCQIGEDRSVEQAMAHLEVNQEVQRYHLYHSYPSPGPVDRYVGAITREHGLKRPA